MTPEREHSTWRWDDPGRPISVELELPVVDRINAEAVRGLGLTPRRGVEVGGLLLGTVAPGTPAVVRVEQNEPILCEYTQGPTYVLNGLDRQRFEKRVRQLSSAEGARPVGYYRSVTAEMAELQETDQLLVDDFFPEDGSLVLLVKASAIGSSSAALFVRENGVLQPGPVFPFRSADLGGGHVPPAMRAERGRNVRNGGAGAVPETEREFQTKPSFSLPPVFAGYGTATERRMTAAAWVTLALSLVILGIAAGARFFAEAQPGSGSGARDAYTLGLRAEAAGEDLKVTWDRNAAALRSPVRAVLRITTGESGRDLDLDPAVLREGNVLYRSNAEEVRLRLEVFVSEQRSVAETLTWKRTAAKPL